MSQWSCLNHRNPVGCPTNQPPASVWWRSGRGPSRSEEPNSQISFEASFQASALASFLSGVILRAVHTILPHALSLSYLNFEAFHPSSHQTKAPICVTQPEEEGLISTPVVSSSGLSGWHLNHDHKTTSTNFTRSKQPWRGRVTHIGYDTCV